MYIYIYSFVLLSKNLRVQTSWEFPADPGIPTLKN